MESGRRNHTQKGKAMLGNFTYDNPTRLHFGDKAMEALAGELVQFGPVVQLSYGGGSIKKNGIYAQVLAALEASGKTVVDDGGVMPNPTLERMLEGAAGTTRRWRRPGWRRWKRGCGKSGWRWTSRSSARRKR